jgi:hypothetical protein
MRGIGRSFGRGLGLRVVKKAFLEKQDGDDPYRNGSV